MATDEEPWRGVVIAEALTDPTIVNDLRVGRAAIKAPSCPSLPAASVGGISTGFA